MSNEELGYNDFFEASRKVLAVENTAVARVIAQYRGLYKVKNMNGEYWAKITGKKMFDGQSREDYPAVGDWVAIVELAEKKAVIHNVLPRRTVIKRKGGGQNKTQIIAANVDVAFVVESVGRDYNLNRLERYFAIANEGGIKPVIIFNKTDLVSSEKLSADYLDQIKARLTEVEVIPTSTLADNGLDDLKLYVKSGKTYCFLGSSGVGKSSLINKLIGKSEIKTGEVGGHSGRGKHVTTVREMYFLANGSMVIDNPGMREVGMTGTGAGIDKVFDEISVLGAKCKYRDCSHRHEPECAVLAAVEAGALNEEKYANYISLKKEAGYYEMTEYERRNKNRQFGRMVKKAKEDFKQNKYKDFSE